MTGHGNLYRYAVARAEYYRWRVARDPVLPGNDPISGRARSRWWWGDEGEGRAAYSAMARYWIDQARRVRLSLPARGSAWGVDRVHP